MTEHERSMEKRFCVRVCVHHTPCMAPSVLWQAFTVWWGERRDLIHIQSELFLFPHSSSWSFIVTHFKKKKKTEAVYCTSTSQLPPKVMISESCQSYYTVWNSHHSGNISEFNSNQVLLVGLLCGHVSQSEVNTWVIHSCSEGGRGCV